MKINFDPSEYRDLASKSMAWIPPLTPNEYEQIERDNSSDENDRESQPIEKRDENLELISKEQNTSTNNITRHRSRSVDDLFPARYDQTFSRNSNLFFSSQSQSLFSSAYHHESTTTSSSSEDIFSTLYTSTIKFL